MAAILIGSSSVLGSCSTVEGYPVDPENTSAVLGSLQAYFDPAMDAQYNASFDPVFRRQLRDTIVLNRLRAYDIEYDIFQRKLFGDSNALSVGGDLVVLALNGAGATTGGAATKAALSAASAGIVGAQGAISKDLFYQRTVPALIAQIDANRANAKIAILTGLNSPDDVYPLARAYVDLEMLKNAGGLPGALSNITQQAALDRQSAEWSLSALSSINFSTSPSKLTIEGWLFRKDASGRAILVPANSRALNAWKKSQGDPVLANIPIATFLNSLNPKMESFRRKAIVDLIGR
ncbi:MAG: hypothetical protein JO273_05690 [Methylobacteriaceae bacterium]|nr:hypothetical protein [Methylobacteriaceae bacterium]